MRSFFLLVGWIMLAGCNVPGTWKDEKIDPDIRSEIGKLNFQIIQAFVTHDPEKIKALGSERLRNDQKNEVWALISHVNKTWDSGKFKIKNQFYVVQAKAGEDTRVVTGSSGDHDYAIHFPSAGREVFVSVGFVEDRVETLALTAIYAKFGDQWKLDLLQVGLLEILRKDAFDWYLKAKENIQKGYVVDAVSSLTLSSKCMNPANQFWNYQKEQEMGAFRATLQKEIDETYTFPLAVNGVTSKPRIFKIFPQGTRDGYYPSIFYNTRLNIQDTTALSNECNEIHRRIGDVFKGLDKNNAYIFYRAFESTDPGNESAKNYGFVRKVEK